MRKVLLSALLAAVFCSEASAQKIAFDHQTITTPTTLWKRPVTAVFRYTNKERTPLQVLSVDGGCGCVETKWSDEPLGRGEEAEISVTYDAKLLGKFDKVIEVHTNASSKPVRLRMKGVVSNTDTRALTDLYEYQIGDVLLDATEVQFPAVYSGDSVTVTIDIANNGSEVYTPQLMHLPPYITAQYKPEMIARGKTGKIELTLHSDKLTDLGLNQTNVYLSRFFGDKVAGGNDIVVSAILLPDLHGMENAPNAPTMHLSAVDVNLGKLGKKTKLAGKVKIANRGGTTLQLGKIQAFNQAVSVSLPKTELQPGEEVTMKISIDSRFLGMSKARPRVLLISNDPKRPMEVVNVNFER